MAILIPAENSCLAAGPDNEFPELRQPVPTAAGFESPLSPLHRPQLKIP